MLFGRMLTFRDASAGDVRVILRMLQDSAAHQGFPDEVAVTETDLLADGFGESPRFRVLLAEWDGTPAGIALYFFNYSTWGSRRGLYLEDLFVAASYRGKGIGRALMVQLAGIALREGCGRFQWVVFSGNEPAVRLYESLGASSLRQWTLMSLKGAAIRNLAEGRLATPGDS